VGGEIATEKCGPRDVTLVIEFFFNDFRVAGDRVIGMRFPRSDKMSRRFIRTDLPVRH
jgi:hypothetical protein